MYATRCHSYFDIYVCYVSVGYARNASTFLIARECGTWDLRDMEWKTFFLIFILKFLFLFKKNLHDMTIAFNEHMSPRLNLREKLLEAAFDCARASRSRKLNLSFIAGHFYVYT